MVSSAKFEMKHVAVMDAGRLDDDFIHGFDTGLPSEATINPSNSGIMFFRWTNPGGGSGESTVDAELRYFRALHENFRARHEASGLDAVVLFANNVKANSTTRPLRDTLDIAAGVKKIHPRIKVLVITPGPLANLGNKCAGEIRAAIRRGDIDECRTEENGKTALKKLVKLSPQYKTIFDYHALHNLLDAYRTEYSFLKLSPQELADTTPPAPAERTRTRELVNCECQ